MIRVKTPFDWIIGHPLFKRVAFIDTKSLDHDVLRYSDVKPHQLMALSDMEACGQIAGYVVYHKSLNTVYFYRAHDIRIIVTGKSIDPENHAVNLGDVQNIQLCKIFG